MATTHPVEIMGNISHRNELLDTNTGKKKSKKSKKKKGSGENNNFTSTTIKIIKSRSYNKEGRKSIRRYRDRR